MATVLNGRIIDHAIVFGLPVKSKKLVQDNWPFGFIYLGSVSSDSISYVTSYVQKKLYGSSAEEFYKYIQPPFSLMSKGLGLRYAQDNKNIFLDKAVCTYRGKNISIPRYFIKKVGTEDFHFAVSLKSYKYQMSLLKELYNEDSGLFQLSAAPLRQYAIYNNRRVLGSLHQLNKRLKASMKGDKND